MDLDLWSKIAQRIEKGHIDPKNGSIYVQFARRSKSVHNMIKDRTPFQFWHFLSIFVLLHLTVTYLVTLFWQLNETFSVIFEHCEHRRVEGEKKKNIAQVLYFIDRLYSLRIQDPLFLMKQCNQSNETCDICNNMFSHNT